MSEGDDRRGVRLEGEQWVFRASSIGYCRKILVAEKEELGKQSPSERMQRAFDLGHEYEDKILLQVVEDVGYKKEWFHWQQRVVLDIADGVSVAGSMDGFVDPGSHTEDYTLPVEFWEVKFLTSKEYAKYKEHGIQHLKQHRVYAWQNSAYLHGLQRQYKVTDVVCRFIVAEKVENEWTGRYTMFMVEEPIISFEDIKARCMEVLQAVELPTCDFQNYPCPFSYLHTDEDDKKSEHVELDFDSPDYQDLYEAYQIIEKGKEWIKEGEAAKLRGYEQVRAIVENLGPKLQFGKQRMTWVRSVKRNYDWDKVPDPLMELLLEYKTKEVISEYPLFPKPKRG